MSADLQNSIGSVSKIYEDIVNPDLFDPIADVGFLQRVLAYCCAPMKPNPTDTDRLQHKVTHITGIT